MQLPFFIFPPNRVRHKKQNQLIKWAKKFQERKWEELCQAEYFHQHGEISRTTKVFTNDSKSKSDPDQYECLQQLFPPPSGSYPSPLQMGDSWRLATSLVIRNDHWSSEVSCLSRSTHIQIRISHRKKTPRSLWWLLRWISRTLSAPSDPDWYWMSCQTSHHVIMNVSLKSNWGSTSIFSS